MSAQDLRRVSSSSRHSEASNRFWRQEEDTPPWFKPEKFLQPDFEPDAYVSDLRRYVPLERLAGELEAHLGKLHTKLFEVINEDYDDFVSLSTKLVNVDSAVLRMKKPLLEVQGKVEAVAEGVQEHLAALDKGLARRLAIAAARSLLELMQDTMHVLSKVEKLLVEAEESRHSRAPAALERQCQLLERLAGEAARLHYNTTRGQELPFVQSLLPRVATADRQLNGLLAEGLTASLEQNASSAWRHCLVAFAAIGNTASAEQVVRQTLVAPAVQAALATAAAGRAPGAAAGADGLAAVLPPMLATILDRCGALLEAMLAPRSGLGAFSLLGNSVLAEIDEALADALPGVFSPGVPSTFHGNFCAAMAFLDELEARCPSHEALMALRNSTAYGSFLRRWKLSVYFSLRFQDIAGELETVLSAAHLEAVPSDKATSNSLALQLLPSLALQQCLNRVIDPDVFLRPLADKGVRLALQLLARFTAWLQSGLAARASSPAASAPQPASRPGAPQAPLQAEAPAPDQPAENGPQQWCIEASVEQLALVRADIDEVAEWVQVDFSQALLTLLKFAPEQIRQGVEDALSDGASALEEQGLPAAAAIVAQIGARCCTSLQQLNAIRTTYRMTNKPTPFRASPYAGSLLAPLKTFLDAGPAHCMRRSAQTAIAQDVLSEVASRFTAVASEMLEQMQKTESSLARLKKARGPEAGSAAGGGGGAAPQLSDIEKMTLQLFLDVQEFGRQSQKVGIDPRQVPAYQELWKAVAPADKSTVEL